MYFAVCYAIGVSSGERSPRTNTGVDTISDPFALSPPKGNEDPFRVQIYQSRSKPFSRRAFHSGDLRNGPKAEEKRFS